MRAKVYVMLILLLSLSFFSCRISVPKEISDAVETLDEAKEKLDQCLTSLDEAEQMLSQCIELCGKCLES